MNLTSLFIFLSFIIRVLSSQLNFNHSPLLRVSTRTHDRSTISNYLQKAYLQLLPQGSETSKRHNLERSCLESTNIKFFLKSLNLTSREYEASECRTNLNSRFLLIVQPVLNIHKEIFAVEEPVLRELEIELIEQFQYHANLRDFEFYRFDGLGYELECSTGYQELVQVKLNATIIVATFDQVTEIPPVCEFENLLSEFGGKVNEKITIVIPMDAQFYCHNGRSSTCKRMSAEYKNPRYRLPSG